VDFPVGVIGPRDLDPFMRAWMVREFLGGWAGCVGSADGGC
jgi:hypothetical protein